MRCISFVIVAGMAIFAPSILLGESSVEPLDLRAMVGTMSLEEKVGQLALRGRGSRGSYDKPSKELIEAVREGRVGSVINLMLPAEVDRLQRIAVEESPHGIPLLFGRDVIHGLHAVAPIPLGQAATWNPDLVREGARAAARDASRYGIRWTFAPMLDIARDSRWGRVAESPGEDPFLASRLAEAVVQGLQGEALSDPQSVAACIKHFAAYGAAEGGRDYNSVSLSESELRNVYLRPFRAAVDANAATVMTAFNEVNGIPASAHHGLLSEILRDEWAFDGFVVSDWNSVTEMLAHGTSATARDAAEQALSAGLDQEMMSRSFEENLGDLVMAGEISEAAIDEAVLRILSVKKRLGLFDAPYRSDMEDPTSIDRDSLDIAHRLALESAVLLKNDGVLPIDPELGRRIAVIGPLANAPREQLGTWAFDGRAEDSRTPVVALRERLGEGRVLFAQGLKYSRESSRDGFEEAIEAARRSDLVVFFGGEEAILSGEAHSRARLRLPGAQEDLIRELAAIGKPVVLVLLSGRPISLYGILGEVDAVLAAWHPGTMAGPALAGLLLGDTSPSGRLPVTWPKASGQLPLYFGHKNTGRPAQKKDLVAFEDIPVGAWQSSLSNTSHYLDLGMDPQFPFGFGMTYSSFEYRNLEVSPERIARGDRVRISAEIANTGDFEATETVQLYFRDRVSSRTRPVRELAGFQRLTLSPGASSKVMFELGADDLAYFDGQRWVTEPGSFSVWIAPHARAGMEGAFELSAEGATARALPSPEVTGFVERLDARLDRLISADASPVVLAEGFEWSEGPLWSAADDALLFSDVPVNAIYRWRAGDGLSRWLDPSGYTGDEPRGGEPGSNGLWFDEQGDLLLCQHGDRRIARLAPPFTGESSFETVADRYEGRRFNSPNDLVLSSRGELYFTDPPYGLEKGPEDPAREQPANGVYKVSPAGEVTLVSDALTRPNGIALSPDERTLYVANSDHDRAIWMAFDLDEKGEVVAERVFFDATPLVGLRPGLPDGLVIDASGHLFATGPGGILVFTPQGDHLGTVRIDRPTSNCTFGENGSTLFMTADDRLLRLRTRARGLGFD